LSRFVCPIGIAGIERKESAVIAAAVAAQLLIARDYGDTLPYHQTQLAMPTVRQKAYGG
jgi:xanthine/CO dehydrogenase XdhC/CoxF family maturation factor